MVNLVLHLKYRITGLAGVLYLRDSLTGDIIARIPSHLTTSSPDNMNEVVSGCSAHLVGTVASVLHEDDSVHVVCEITTGVMKG